MFNFKKKKKGFTLIELIVVIAVLGILVLLAAPKFLGYTKDAKLAQIVADIKTIENSVNAELTEDDDFISGWTSISKEKMGEYQESKDLVSKKGLIENNKFEGEYVKVERENLPKSRLPGDFIYEVGGAVYYYEKDLDFTKENSKDDNPKDEEVIVPDLNADTDGDGLSDGDEVNIHNTDPLVKDTDDDGLLDGDEVNVYKTNPLVKDTDDDGLLDGDEVNIHKTNPLVKDSDGDGLSDGDEVNVYKTNPLVKDTDGDGIPDGQEITDKTDPLDPLDPTKYDEYTASDSDFIWVGSNESQTYIVDGKQGYYKYNGKSSIVKIPETIKGWKVDSLAYMFKNSNAAVKKVVSDSPAIKDISYMFTVSYSTEMDVTDINTENVTNMIGVFSSSLIKSVDVGEWDTSKVKSMSKMFYNARAVTINGLQNFNTSSVTQMNSMFQSSYATQLNVTGWDTSKVTDMNSMFNNSEATKIVGIENWNVSSNASYLNMFYGSAIKELDLSKWNVSGTAQFGRMFKETKNLESLNVSNWKFVKEVDFSYMFEGSALKVLDLSSWKGTTLKWTTSMFASSVIEELDISGFTGISMNTSHDMFSSSKVKKLYVNEARYTTMKSYMKIPTTTQIIFK